MGTVMPQIPGAAGGAVTGLQNMGKPVTGNASGNNQYSPTMQLPGTAGGVGGVPGAGISIPGGSFNSGVVTQMPMATTSGPAGTPTAPTTPLPVAPASTTAPNTGQSAATYGDTMQQNNNITKQLNDTYGKGEGTLLNNLINNIGSNDSTYMQAYQAAMANPNAEGLATLQTQLGNSGVSANSSAAAIEQADYQSNVTSQEGLQEQQLQEQGLQDTVGLVQSMEGATNKEATTGSVLGDIGSVLGAVGDVAAGVATGGLSLALPGGTSGLSGVLAGNQAIQGMSTETDPGLASVGV